MKKVLIAKALEQKCREQKSFLDRSDIATFFATTTDELLTIHRKEKTVLIVTTLDLPGMRFEDVFDIIRQDKDLRSVSIVIVCEDTYGNQMRATQCGANAVLGIPVDAPVLLAAMQRLLNIAPRKAYRVALNVAVEGKFNNRPFLYRTENLSASGMLIRAEGIFAPDDRLSLSFYLPDGRRVSVHGKISRIVEKGTTPGTCLYGVQFVDLTPDDRLALEAFIQKELGFARSLSTSLGNTTAVIGESG